MMPLEATIAVVGIWRMIWSENRVPLFRIMLFLRMIWSENRFPLFRIML